MTNSDKISRGIRTSDTQSIPDAAHVSCSDSDRSTCISVAGNDTTKGNEEEKRESDLDSRNLPETEITSTTCNEDELYKMRANGRQVNQFTPSKIEFKRIKRKTKKCCHNSKFCSMTPRPSKQSVAQSRKLVKANDRKPSKEVLKSSPEENTFLSRLKRSFSKMRQNSLPVKDSKSSQSPACEDLEKMDIYYFDHGNAAYFRTTDCPPTILSEMLARQTTYYATRFWAEIFGSIHIGITFFITFFLQTYRFILYSIVRAVIVGFFQMTSDYLLKPILTVLFNGILQPVLILFYNILSSVKDMLEPVAETIGSFLSPIAMLLQSIRLVTIENKTYINRHKELEEDKSLSNSEEV